MHTCADLLSNLLAQLSAHEMVTLGDGPLPHVRRTQEVLVLNVDEVLGAANLLRVAGVDGYETSLLKIGISLVGCTAL